MAKSVSHEKGDLFKVADRDSIKSWAIVHCISEDCCMGKGVAVLFKKRFGGVDELKKQVAGGKKTGSAAVLEREDRLVFYLITKKFYYNKPTYQSLEAALKDMVSVMAERGVDGCVMPRIGCGLDRLEWEKVENIIEEVFSEKKVSALVCTL